MKSRMPIVIGVVVAAVVVGAFLVRSQGTGPTDTPVPSAPTQPAAAPEGPVVHTFQTEEALREFAGLWQGRQTIVVRMQVLQSYWEQEQAILAETNGRLNTEYGVEPSENYFLNTDERILIQRPAPAEGETEPGPVEEGTTVHTFSDEDAMRVFAELWQQRQAVLLRSRVLEAYWRNEQDNLRQINERLSSTYALDPAKNYFLDGQRRVIIEVEGEPEAPPVPPAANAPPMPAAPAPDAEQ